jgi:hypothetical protein
MTPSFQLQVSLAVFTLTKSFCSNGRQPRPVPSIVAFGNGGSAPNAAAATQSALKTANAQKEQFRE